MYFNRAAAEELKWEAGQPPAAGDSRYPFDREILRGALSGNVTGSLGAGSGDSIFTRADGGEFYARYSATPLGSGEVAGAVVVFRNVTRERDVELRLRRSETYLEEGQRLSRSGSWALGSERGMPVYWSPELCRIYGREPGEGPPSFTENSSLHTPESWERLVGCVSEAFNGNGFECDTELVFPGGERKHLRIVGSPVMDSSGNVTEVVGLTMDVTERYLTEKSLREALALLSRKNRYETIISTVTRGVHKSLELDEVLQNAALSMSENIESPQRVEIFLVEDDDAVLKAHKNLPEWYYERVKRIPYAKGFTWKTIVEGRSFYVPETKNDTVIGPAGREAGTRSYISTPVFSGGRAVGAVNVTSSEPGAFDEEDLKLLDTVARQIEQAMSNARQADELRKALAEVRELKDRIQAENAYLMEEIKTGHNFEEIIGESRELRKVFSEVERVAPTGAAVLVLGETGTGKELIARAIHNLSPRRGRPLVKVNCGAISAGLVESELFGHERGAFTGAVMQREGRFELADGGTIFLDEVADLPMETQVKLLRVLQEGEFERVGSSRMIKTDVRVIAATNRNLKDEVRAGTFRADLFYRLNVFPIELPPLRERTDDIPILAAFFITKYARELGKGIAEISEATMRRLMEYGWPGNIRELENVIERAVILARGSSLEIDESMFESEGGAAAAPEGRRLENVERNHIREVLEECAWVIDGNKGAAAALGLNPATLRSRMKKLGLSRPPK